MQTNNMTVNTISKEDIELLKQGQQWAEHRSPYEAARADYYYGRECKPNFSYGGVKYSEAEMQGWQIEDYKKGWAVAERDGDRKDWGYDRPETDSESEED